MKHSWSRAFITAMILGLVVLGATPSYSQIGYPITACGTLKDGLYCKYFSPFTGGTFLLDDYGTFQVGDTVQITGYIYPDDQYQCWCATYQSPCIRSNTISQAVLPCYSNGACGSFDCDSLVDYTDYLLGTNYLEGGIYPLQCPDIADFDGYGLYTVHDLALLRDSIFRHTGTAQCPPGLTPFDPPVSTSDYLSYRPTVYPPGVPKFSVTIGIAVSDTSDWFNIPFVIKVGGVIATVDSVVKLGSWNVQEFGETLWLREWGTKKVPSTTYPLQTYDVCRLVVRAAVADTNRPITVVFDTLGPNQNGSPVNTPMVIRSYVGRPTVFPAIVPQAPSHSPRTVLVPSEFATIQLAIDSSVNDDTILVSPGVYSENIDFAGKKLIIRSTHGRTLTEIHGQSTTAATVTIATGEPTGTTLDGFKISGGANSGIACAYSKPTIINNEITGNHNGDSWNDGGGITMESCTIAIIRGNIFHHNITHVWGGSVFLMNCQDISITYNLAYANDALAEFEGFNSTGVFYNNTVSVTRSAGLELRYYSTFDARNNIIFFSNSHAALTANPQEGGSITNDYNCLFANTLNSDVPLGPHTILVDAQFVDTAGRSYFLRANSPCIDAGDPDPAFNDPDGSRNDIGAFPFAWNCCLDVTGNVNMSGTVDLADLSLLVAYLTGGGIELPCPEEANVNGVGIVDLADLSALVSYLTGGGFVLPACG